MNLYDDTKTIRELTKAHYQNVRDDVKGALLDALTAFRTYCDEADHNNVAAAINDESETLTERLHEEADAAVTYTMDAKTILLVSENEDAAEEELGEEEARQLTVEQRAYYAYMADCQQLLGNPYFLDDMTVELREDKAPEASA